MILAKLASLNVTSPVTPEVKPAEITYDGLNMIVQTSGKDGVTET